MGGRLRLALLLVLAAGVVLIGLSALQAATFPVARLADTVPVRTAMMRQREAEARRAGRTYRVDRRWVSYERISPLLRRAVLVAEDDAYYRHSGLDWNEISASARENLERRRIVRGGSTITQQLARNLFLGDARTPTRKLTEVFLAFRLERALSKRRILELYLNLIEWGDGIFGAEAAARRHFGVPATALSPRQAVLLAAIVINPRRYSPLQPARRIERRSRMIASRMRRHGYLTEEQYLLAAGKAPAAPPSFTDWFFGPKEPELPEAPVGEPPADSSSGAPAPTPAPAPEAPPDTGATLNPPGPP